MPRKGRTRTRARELKLRIADDNPELEKILWESYLGIESYMSLRKPFDPLEHYLLRVCGFNPLLGNLEIIFVYLNADEFSP